VKKSEAMQRLINDSSMNIGEICEELNVSRFIVHKWRSGESNPRRENLNKLAKINNISIHWVSNDNVEINSLDLKNIPLITDNINDNSRVGLIIDNQLDLIDVLKKDNITLKQNLLKFQLSKSIVNDHDYSLTRAIDTQKMINIKIPNKGLLGYSKQEFKDLASEWSDSTLWSKKISNKMIALELARVNLAKELQIDHFDISDHIVYNCKNDTKRWAYYIKYYSMKLNSINIYVKFLNIINE